MINTFVPLIIGGLILLAIIGTLCAAAVAALVEWHEEDGR